MKCAISVGLVNVLVTFSLLALYMLLGAVIFTFTELPHEKEVHRQAILKFKEDNATVSPAVQSLTYKYNESACIALEALEYFRHPNVSDSEEFSWTYTKSIMFTFSTITTLGYGDMIPTTHIGKGMTILFAITTIPLYFMMVMVYAEHGFAVLKLAVNKLKPRDSNRAFLYRHVILSAILLLSGLTFGAVFAVNTGSRFGDALWFTFSTFTTIGFGDVVPPNDNTGYAVFFIIYVTFVYVIIGVIALSWQTNFLRILRTVSTLAGKHLCFCCDVTIPIDFHRVEVGGVSRLEEEPTDAVMETVQMDPVISGGEFM